VSERLRTIVAAVDFSECSDRALEAAIDLARSFGATLHVVHAFDLPVPMFNPYAVSVPVAYVTEAREAASRKLEQAVEKVRAEGIEVHGHLGEIPAAPAIVRVADDLSADLIVIGTRGHTGIKHALLGSVAERTVRTAPCSVLTVKDTEGEVA